MSRLLDLNDQMIAVGVDRCLSRIKLDLSGTIDEYRKIYCNNLKDIKIMIF